MSKQKHIDDFLSPSASSPESRDQESMLGGEVQSQYAEEQYFSSLETDHPMSYDDFIALRKKGKMFRNWRETGDFDFRRQR